MESIDYLDIQTLVYIKYIYLPFLPVHVFFSSQSFLILSIPYKSAPVNIGHGLVLYKLIYEYKNTYWSDFVSIIPQPSFLILHQNGLQQLLWYSTKTTLCLSWVCAACYSDIPTQKLWFPHPFVHLFLGWLSSRVPFPSLIKSQI